MKIILIRHGQTHQNVAQTIQGQTEGQLTDEGIRQAKKLGERLKDEKIDVIISSDLLRVRATVEEIIKHHKLIPVVFDKEARERNFGVFEGRNYNELLSERERLGQSRFEHRPEGGESYEQFRKRAERFFEKVYKEHSGKTVLVAAHGGFNKVLLSVMLNISLENAVETIEQHNTCVNIIEIKDRKNPKVHTINCIKHLEIE